MLVTAQSLWKIHNETYIFPPRKLLEANVVLFLLRDGGVIQ
jgi:hypothetical protein